MFFTILNRVKLLEFLPQNATVAELGVANGGFSRRILQVNKPKKLHLIDPWGGADDEYVRTYRVRDPMEHSYQKVLNLLAEPLSSNQVEIHRGYSYDVFPKFDDGMFDWVFVDGMHTYEAVLQDLYLVENKVAADGFIMGHDFTNTGRESFGVIPAVLEFLAARPNYRLICVTYEKAPSYVIAKNPESEIARKFQDDVIEAQPIIFEVGVDRLSGLSHRVLQRRDGTVRHAFRLA